MSEYEPLEIDVEKFKGKREALGQLLEALHVAIMKTKHSDFEFTCMLREVAENKE